MEEIKEPDWLGSMFGEEAKTLYFIRRVPKKGPMDEDPKVLCMTYWKSPLTGEYLFDWFKREPQYYDVLYFNTASEAKLALDNAKENEQIKGRYEPSKDSVYSTFLDE